MKKLILALWLLTCVEPVWGDLANGIEAVVDDSVITYHEVNMKNPKLYEQIVNQYSRNPSLLEQQLTLMRGENLDLLVQNQLIMHDFKTAGYSLPESVLDDIVKERIRDRFHDRATLTKSLEEEGMTYEKFRQQVRDQFIVEAMRSKNISSEIIISPHKIENYYTAHKDEFKEEEQVKLRVIVLKPSDDTNAPPVAKLADEILAKLDEGAAFEEMATIYSQDSHRNQAGDWGWYYRSGLTKGLADVAFALPTGKHSGVFCRSYGDDYWVYQFEHSAPTLGRHYGVDAASKKQNQLEERKFEDASSLTNLPEPREFYVLKVEDRKPEHFKTLIEVRPFIEKSLLDEERTRLGKQYLDKLRKKTFVRTVF